MLLPYFNDFNYFYLDENNVIIEVDSVSKVPEGDDIKYGRIMDAVAYFQQLGMARQPIQFKLDTHLYEDYDFYYEILKIGYKRYGQKFDVLYRGCNSDRPDSGYKIIYTSDNRDVASFYGTVKEYRNVMGFLTHGNGTSVVSGDYDQIDNEIIVIPNL